MKQIKTMIIGIMLVIAIVGTKDTFGRVITVDQNGGSDFTMIANAIADSAEGDQLVIHGGLYTEAVVLKNNQTLEGQGNVTISNPEGTSIITSANNEIRNIRIIESGSHAIWGENVESIVIESVEIQNFNLLEWDSRPAPDFSYFNANEAVNLSSGGNAIATIQLDNLHIENGKGGGINLTSKDSSILTCSIRDSIIKKLDASDFVTTPPNFPGSPGFSGVFILSRDNSVLTVKIENVLTDEIGDSSSGILSNADDFSVLHLDVRRFTFDDSTNSSGVISGGIEVIGVSSSSTVNAKVEECDMLNSNGFGFSNYNWSGTNQGIIDFGGGPLGSKGLNRIVGNAFHVAGANPLPITAKNNYWGNSRGLVSKAIDQGSLTIDIDPILVADPRPNGIHTSVESWDVYE